VFLTLFPPAFYSNPLYPYCRWRLSPLTSQCHQGPARQGVVKHFLSGKRRPHSYAWSPMKLTATERDRLARMRARPCKHGHLRHDARVYRNATGSLWLDCAQCVRDRVNAYRRRIAAPGCAGILIGLSDQDLNHQRREVAIVSLRSGRGIGRTMASSQGKARRSR
jgi:hypothetical protein